MKVDYRIVDSIRDIPDIGETVVFDLETSSVQTHNENNRIVGVGLAWEEGKAYYIPFNKWVDSDTLECASGYHDELERIENKILANPDIKIRGHNIKFDMRVCHAHKLPFNNIEFDSMIASYCMKSDRMRIGEKDNSPTGHSLDDVCLHHLNFVKIRTKHVLGKKKKGKAAPTMLDVPIDECGFYCCEDVDWTLRACERFEHLFELNEYASRLFYEIEMPLCSKVIIPMECNGVMIDSTYIHELMEDYGERKAEALRHICDIAGQEIEDTLPRPVLEKIIYDVLKLPEEFGLTIKKTPSGARPTNVDTLELMKEHPFVEGLLTVKSLHKLISTYLGPIPDKVSAIDGFLHAEFLQHITATGRLSSKNPNLQNIPQRTELGRQVRKAFISRFPGGRILAVDWSQCELRIMAHLAHEQVFIDIFNEGGDAHTAVAALLNNLDPSEVTPEMRSHCKTLNFGMLYQMGSQKLAASTGMTPDEAKGFIAKYLGRMEGISAYRKSQRTLLKKQGYVETIFGRRRYLSKIHADNSEAPPDRRWIARSNRESAIREGGNMPVQGTNADICKMAMLDVQDVLRKEQMKSLIILQVHDELVLDTHPDELDKIKPMVEEIMANIIELIVPLVCDGKYGMNWGEAH